MDLATRRLAERIAVNIGLIREGEPMRGPEEIVAGCYAAAREYAYIVRMADTEERVGKTE